MEAKDPVWNKLVSHLPNLNCISKSWHTNTSFFEWKLLVNKTNRMFRLIRSSRAPQNFEISQTMKSTLFMFCAEVGLASFCLIASSDYSARFANGGVPNRYEWIEMRLCYCIISQSVYSLFVQLLWDYFQIWPTEMCHCTIEFNYKFADRRSSRLRRMFSFFIFQSILNFDHVRFYLTTYANGYFRQ